MRSIRRAARRRRRAAGGALGRDDLAADGSGCRGSSGRGVEAATSGSQVVEHFQAARTRPKYVRPFCSCQFRSVRSSALRSERPVGERRQDRRRPPIVAPVERGVVDERCSSAASAISAIGDEQSEALARWPAARRPTPTGRQQRHDEMRRQEEDVGVADVVAEGEGERRRRRSAARSAARRQFVPSQVHEPADGREWRHPPELLRADRTRTCAAVRSPSTAGTSSTIVSRQSAFVTSNQNVRSASREAGGRHHLAPERREVPRVLQRAERARSRDASDDARATDSDRQPPGAPRQQEQRVGRQQQNHRQMVAEGRARRRRRTSTAGGRRLRGPAQQQQQRQATRRRCSA